MKWFCCWFARSCHMLINNICSQKFGLRLSPIKTSKNYKILSWKNGMSFQTSEPLKRIMSLSQNCVSISSVWVLCSNLVFRFKVELYSSMQLGFIFSTISRRFSFILINIQLFWQDFLNWLNLEVRIFYFDIRRSCFVYVIVARSWHQLRTWYFGILG